MPACGYSGLQSLPQRGRVGEPGASRGRRGGGPYFAQSLVNHLKHTLEISINFGVPEPQHLEPLSSKVAITALIAILLPASRMLAAIDFDDHTSP